MALDPFAVRICNIARQNRGVWPQRRIELMTAAGLFDPANRLDEKAIRDVIEADPSLFGDWLAWSEDKRYDGAWLGRKNDDNISACAWFIVAELGAFKEIRERKAR